MDEKSPKVFRQSDPATGWNAGYIDDLYDSWKRDPESVGESWRHYFEGFELGRCAGENVSVSSAAPLSAPVDGACDRAESQSKINRLILAYRSLGHLVAQANPIGLDLPYHPDLDLNSFGFRADDYGLEFDSDGLLAEKTGTLERIVTALQDTYTRSIGVEYMHIQNLSIRRWLRARMEPVRNQPSVPPPEKLELLHHLIDAELFETFLHTRYPGQKRFSLEGAETSIAALCTLIDRAPEYGVEHLVMGMPHRGRLNVISNILRKSFAEIFSEFEDIRLEAVGGSGDVKYHKGYSSVVETPSGKSIQLDLAANPSHLEAVDPVVLGKARALQRMTGDTEKRTRVLPLLLHGDAAFAGQGLVAETLNLSQLAGYRVGGTIHFIVNNQIGFTTSPKEARSSHYATDVAKMIEAPIFHVNGEDPEAVAFVMDLALAFRQEFGRDVVVDMLCYRRHGHNEGDDPGFTQPILYKLIKTRPSVRKQYTDKLLLEGILTPEADTRIAEEFKSRLQSAFDQVKNQEIEPLHHHVPQQWEGLENPYSFDPLETGVSHESLMEVVRGLTSVPEGFSLNRKIARKLPDFMENIEHKHTVDWGQGELLAFGSLLAEGTPVRLSGQDCARGTFSHRHAEWFDSLTEESYKALNHIREGQAHFCVYNSMLSEAAVLGFDFGYSLAEPGMLIIWEAQFGDFANGAQVIIDQFLVSSEAKWQRTSGLVMLLPHGYEGQGPEHSNAYLERYLMATADDNIQVCNITTPAQYFHVLRRQMKRDFRRPLVVMSPKSLLRHKEAVSDVAELESGHFREILDDPQPPEKTTRILFCSGKVYYDLLKERRESGHEDVAIVRVEQFYPFNRELFREIVGRYENHAEWVWVQEEPRNRGGWTFMSERFREIDPERRVRYVGRPASASPASGSMGTHKAEQEGLVKYAFISE